MENAVYWKGRQVGIECAGRILWFASAPQAAIAEHGETREEPAAAEDSIVARNLVMAQSSDRSHFSRVSSAVAFIEPALKGVNETGLAPA